MVVEGEEEPMPMGRTDRGPPDAWRGDMRGVVAVGAKKAVDVDSRSVARRNFILNWLGPL